MLISEWPAVIEAHDFQGRLAIFAKLGLARSWNRGNRGQLCNVYHGQSEGPLRLRPRHLCVEYRLLLILRRAKLW